MAKAVTYDRKEDDLSITTTIKGKPPRLPFKDIKDDILGKRYVLSLVFIGDTRSRKLNKTYRGKDTPANVLSFPISKTEGEMFMNPRRAKRDACRFDMNPRAFMGFLFIHGLLHLKGYRHGSKMEGKEDTWRKKYNL